LGGARLRLAVADVVHRHAVEVVTMAARATEGSRGLCRARLEERVGAAVVGDEDVVAGEAGAAGVVVARPGYAETGRAGEGRQGGDRAARWRVVPPGAGLAAGRCRLAVAGVVAGHAVEGVGVAVNAREVRGGLASATQQWSEGGAIVGDVDVVKGDPRTAGFV